MSYKAVPTNFLQHTNMGHRNEAYKPDPSVRVPVSGVILKVYDQETLETEEPPHTLKMLLKYKPGALYALVRQANGREYFLEFADSEEQVFSTYGVRLEGRACDIMVQNLNVEGGIIIPSKNNKEQPINLARQTRSLSISKLV